MRRRVAGLCLAGGLLVAPVMAPAEATRPARAARTAARTTAVEATEPATPPATTASAPVTTAPSVPSSSTPTASPAPSPFTTAGGTLLVGSLVLVGLLYAAARVIRRMPIARFLPSADGPIRIASRTHLGARESLCLVDVGTTTLLLAVTGQSIQTLHVWPDGVKTTPAPPSFAGPGATPSVPGQLRQLAARLSGGR